ncbi:hypothetical protein FGE12_18195 [Aggregicoccus sp. 17bor-14]|uniref:COG3014 family protein n=1 Tax=Myxococcaceae TaxID=31 RepID=UPI00129D1451|nr:MULTISPECIES: hypothetical protein [Myxococcaceae]MBF5044335.1 hypothetical protein [Simulacricoccus sp. 17bor-14]MRI90082.1 hypothetical protein [Aggregicoccus sp. 17bor-14]
MPSLPSLRRQPPCWRALALALGTLLLSGCAGNYVSRTAGVRQAYEREDYAKAIQQLDDLQAKEKESPKQQDRLLLLMDRGMVLHAAGRWAESIQVLAEADRVASELDITSLSEEAKTLVANERERAYRGEDFEKLMISVLQALNYAQLGQDEDALVEVRRVNERLEKMVRDEKKPYQQLAIARYLGGMLYEDQGEWDSAYIDYARALELEPGLGPLAEPVLRLAKRTGRTDEYEKLVEHFPDLPHAPLGPDEGQVVVVVETGLSPEKQSQDRNANGSSGEGELIAVPVYVDRGLPPRAQVSVVDADAGAGRGNAEAQTATTVTSISSVAKVNLEDRVGRMLLKQVAGVAVKAGLAGAAGAATKSKEVAALTFLVLNAFNAPDLRSWLSLPAEFQLARFRLPSGKHTLQVDVGGRTRRVAVEVKPRRVATVVVRRP